MSILSKVYRTNNPKIYMEIQKTMNCKSNLVEKRIKLEILWSLIQTMLQGYHSQNSMVLAQKQTHRPVEHNRDSLEKGMLPTPVFLPGKSHGQRRLVGYSLCSCKESDTTQQLTLSQLTYNLSSVWQKYSFSDYFPL